MGDGYLVLLVYLIFLTDEQAGQHGGSPTLLLLQHRQEEADGGDPQDSLQYAATHSGTVLSDFSAFTRIITKSQDSALIIQNRTPGAMYVLPPGPLKIKFNTEQPDTTGDYLHTGGWMIIHKYRPPYTATTPAKST